jgi:hypothetical protein
VSICSTLSGPTAGPPIALVRKTADTAKPKKTTPFDEKVKSSKKTEGLFTLYQDTATGTMQLYVKKQQLGDEFIYQSFSLNGPTALYLNQSMHRTNFIFKVQKTFDKLEQTTHWVT